MKLLLINKNPVVSRMIKMGVQKAGDVELVESESVNELPLENVDVVMIDDELYDDNIKELLKSKITYKKIGVITSSEEEKVKSEFDFILPKPFLPTDLLELLRRLKEEVKEDSDSKEDIDSFEDETAQESDEEELPPEVASLKKAIEKRSAPVENLVEIEENETLQKSEEEDKEVTKQESDEGLEEVEKENIDEESQEVAAEDDSLEKEAQESFAEDEESPLVEQPPQKSGILDEEEANKLNELLNEEQEPSEEEADKDLAEENQEEPKEESQEEIQEESQEEPQEEVQEESQEEPQEEVQEESQEELQEEQQEESSKEDEGELLVKESQEEVVDKNEVQESLNDISSNIETKKTLLQSAPELLSEPKEEDLQKISHLLQQSKVEPLSVQKLKELLDGMQLDITIKISFPGKKDV